jgi:hypothetical protein
MATSEFSTRAAGIIPRREFIGLSLVEYWKAYENAWLQLAQIVFDFLAIPAISYKYGRVFRSYGKIIIAESSRLSGKILYSIRNV